MPPAGIKGNLFAITGAASGIGRATAELLAANGALLSLADKDGEAVLQFAESLGGNAWACKVDVTNREEVERWMTDTTRKFGRVLDGK